MKYDRPKKRPLLEDEKSLTPDNTDIHEVVLQMEREYYKQQKEKSDISELKRRHHILKVVR